MPVRTRLRGMLRRSPETSLVQLGAGARLATPRSVGALVEIGRGTGVNDGLTTIGIGTLRIGAFAAIGRDLWVRTENHDHTRTNLQVTLARTVGQPAPAIADDVHIGSATWVGDRVTLLAGADIGVGAIVAAGALVPRASVPPFEIWGGVPARRIGTRFPAEVVAVLLDVAWWEWDDDRLRRNAAFLGAQLSALSADAVRALIVA